MPRDQQNYIKQTIQLRKYIKFKYYDFLSKRVLLVNKRADIISREIFPPFETLSFIIHQTYFLSGIIENLLLTQRFFAKRDH